MRLYKRLLSSLIQQIYSQPANDTYYEQVTCLMHFDGTNGSQTIVDETGKTTGTCVASSLSTSDKKFGTASLYLTGGGAMSYISCPSHAGLVFGASDDFTIELWTKPTSIAGDQYILAKGSGLKIYQSGSNLAVALSSTNNTTYFVDNTNCGQLVLNAWNHIALTKEGTYYRLFLNGIKVELSSTSSTINTGTSTLFLGRQNGGDSYQGYIDEFRLTKGIARYNANFTVPSSAFSNVGPTITGSGYFGGGYSISHSNKIEGILFSTEAAINPSAVLSAARDVLAGASSSTKGYFAGGRSGSNLPSTEIEGILFSTEAAINPSAVLSVARIGLSGVSASTKGYFAGGGSSVGHTEIDGIDFTTESAINPSAALSVARVYLAGVNSPSKGYWAGGMLAGWYSAEIEAIDFATEAYINSSAALTVGRTDLAGVNSSYRGYLGGGESQYSLYATEIDGILFSTEAAINPSAVLSVGRRSLSGVSALTKGYFAGGGTGSGNSNKIDGLVFSVEVTAGLSSVLATARAGLAGVQSK